LPVSRTGGRTTKGFGVLEDVTDQKEAEHMLMMSQNELHNVVEMRQPQKLQSIGELMGGIAHEINTPVDTGRALSPEAGRQLFEDSNSTDSETPTLVLAHAIVT
jgi:C4-dicarboxylate-specific signal transduction histidine kinase